MTLTPEPTVRRPLSWYVGRLERGVPTVSLLYGDGEFAVASGRYLNRAMQNGEVVTLTAERETRDSLRAEHDGPDLLRATDPFILDWRCYGGQDVAAVRKASEQIEGALRDVRPEGGIEWLDGRVWDDAVRSGELAPFVRWLSRQRAVVVCNPGYASKWFPWGAGTDFVHVPKANAVAQLEQTWDGLRARPNPLYLLCCGIGAILLAMRLRREFPGCTVLDLGSTLDVFFDLGRERGWRNAIYNDSTALKALRRANLEGLT